MGPTEQEAPEAQEDAAPEAGAETTGQPSWQQEQTEARPCWCKSKMMSIEPGGSARPTPQPAPRTRRQAQEGQRHLDNVSRLTEAVRRQVPQLRYARAERAADEVARR